MIQVIHNPRLFNEVAGAINVLYQSVKQRKINEYLKDIQNVKEKNGKRKNI